MSSARNVLSAAIVILLAVPLLLSPSCVSPPLGQNAAVQVNPDEAQLLIQDHVDDPGFVILDVRNPEEFAAGHIADAVNVCFLCGTFGDDVASLDKSKTYLVYCRSDNRSALAVAQMSQQGFTNLYDLTGGVQQWQAKGLPVVQ